MDLADFYMCNCMYVLIIIKEVINWGVGIAWEALWDEGGVEVM